MRRTPALRRLVAQTRLSSSDLVLPLFVKEGISEPAPIASMPGVVQHTRDSLRKAAAEAVADGVGGLILFGIPAHKDARGSGADDPSGIVQLALRDLVSRGRRRDRADDRPVSRRIHRPRALRHGCRVSVRRAQSSTTMRRSCGTHRSRLRRRVRARMSLHPSGMMDGQVAAIRAGLDNAGFADVAILAYAAKYASALYGPFRDAAECAPRFGDRRTYQQDVANSDEALREVALDIAEGADMVMVKPAMAYLDVVARVRDDGRCSGRGVSGQRRVRDGRGSRCERLARSRERDPRVFDVDPSGRRRHCVDLLGS